MVLAIGLVIANKKEKVPKSIQEAVTQPIKISACNINAQFANKKHYLLIFLKSYHFTVISPLGLNSFCLLAWSRRQQHNYCKTNLIELPFLVTSF